MRIYLNKWKAGIKSANFNKGNVLEIKKHQEHIACVPASLFKLRENGVHEYKLKGEDVFFAQRKFLEGNPDYRQVLPIAVFVYNGLVWAYRRENTSGESRLVGKISISPGGHLDLMDAAHVDSIVDVARTFEQALARELDEELVITSDITHIEMLDKVIVADATPVDRDHVAIVSIYHLDGDGIESNESQLKGLGFIDPAVLLDEKSGYDLEVWARMICEFLVERKKLAVR